MGLGSLNLVSRAFPFLWGVPATRREKPWERGWGSLWTNVNKMADATLSSEDEEIENPIETAVSRGASLVEREKASISRKRKVIVTSHLDSTKGCLICGN